MNLSDISPRYNNQSPECFEKLLPGIEKYERLFYSSPMKDLHLTSEEVIDLRTAHAAERNCNATYKINTIILLGTGWTSKKVRDALLLDTETLRSYVKKYQAGGISTLSQTNYLGKQVNLDESFPKKSL